MKVIILLLLLIVVISAQVTSEKVANSGEDIINYLEGDMNGTYLVLFYDRNSDVKRVANARKDTKEKILTKYPEINYYEVDIDDSGYQSLVNLLQLDRVELEHMPTYLLLSQGLGYTVHGEGSLEDISQSLTTTDWWYVYRHQRTAQEVEDEKNASDD